MHVVVTDVHGGVVVVVALVRFAIIVDIMMRFDFALYEEERERERGRRSGIYRDV